MLGADEKQRILRFIQSLESDSFTFRDVARRLDVDSDQRRALQAHLDDLDARGVIHKIRRGRYTRRRSEPLVAGVLVCHRDGYGFVSPDDRALHPGDIFIPPRNMADAMHGDRVLIKVSVQARSVQARSVQARTTQGRAARPGRSRRPASDAPRVEGFVVEVLERKFPSIVGRYYSHPRFPYVVPLDNRLLHDVHVHPHHSQGARDGEIVVAALTVPPGKYQSPTGRIVDVLGFPDEPGIEYRIVQHKFSLPVAFSPETLRQVASVPGRVLPAEIEGREDLRGRLAVTIDGETARDFDDAVSLEVLPSGHYLLGVHIADVAHYVPESSPLDVDAYARGTSVYFPDRVLPMLPHELSSGICSLKPREDRLVYSIWMEIDRRGTVVRHRLAGGVLHSRARLTYTAVAKVLVDGDPAETARHADLVPFLRTMEELCRILMIKRSRRGAVDFDLPEADIRFDDQGKVIEVVAAERNIAHRIIEEFMLVANETVAGILAASGGPGLYRIHEPPDPRKVEEFAEFALALGYSLRARDGRRAPRDFQKFVEQIEGKPEGKFLAYLMLRSFMQARYSEENVGHFGLAADEYTHFTSPIRRYPDLVVHRLLKETQKARPAAEWRESMLERLPEIALHTSARERNADEAEREIEKVKKVQFMAGKVGEEFDAVVLSVTRQGFFVELLDPYVEGFVPAVTLVDDRYTYRERTHSFTGERNRRHFKLGARLRVRLDLADRDAHRLTFSVAPPR